MSATYGDRSTGQWRTEYAEGSEVSPRGLGEQYRPLVVGYLRALTGSDGVARQLADETLAEAAARIAPHPAAFPSNATVAAQLLLAATDLGLVYLRQARALQLAGVGGPARVRPPQPAGPSQWLRGAFERFRSTADGDEPRRVPVRSAQAGQRGQPAAPTQRMAGGPRSQRVGQGLSRDQVRRRSLRAVLADIPPEGAHCLALHLVAGLSAPEIAWVLGLLPEVVAMHVTAGVTALALRYDSALELLGLSPSLFEPPLQRASQAYIVVPADLHAPPTLRQPAAVAPTLRLGPAERAARRAPPTLPAPRRSPQPQSLRIVPVLSVSSERGRERAASDTVRREAMRPTVDTCPRLNPTNTLRPAASRTPAPTTHR